MHYLVGLQRLGYDVWYIEDGGANPYDPRVASVMMECGYNVGFLRRAMESHGLGGRWAYWDAIHDEWHGLSRDRVQCLYREADGLINLCGATQLRDEHLACPVRIMVDSDPIYEQIKYARPIRRPGHISTPTPIFSAMERIWDRTTARCRFRSRLAPNPALRSSSIYGRKRRARRPAFRRSPPGKTRARTSNLPARDYVWSKHVNFLRFLDLPRRQPATWLQPGDGSAGCRGAPKSNGCRLEPRRSRSRSPRGWTPIATSSPIRAASSLSPKTSMCGRIAAGSAIAASAISPPGVRWSRCAPVFANSIRSVAGLFEFATMEEAIDAIDAISADYRLHSRAARELAAEYFAADRVLGALMSAAGL